MCPLGVVKSYEQGKSLAPRQFIFFLKDWFMNHIGVEDNNSVYLYIKEILINN